MRSWLTAALIFVGTLCALPAAADDLEVKLSSDRDWLRASVVNVSPQAIPVQKDFGYSIFDLSFEVRDLHGRERDFLPKVNGGPSPLINLASGRHMRTKVSFDHLALDYGLEAGLYDVTAVYPLYSPDFRVIETYRSNTLRIKVEGDYKLHMTRMKQRGEIFEIDLSAFRAPERATPRCLVPKSRGAKYHELRRDSLWDKFFTAAPRRLRRSVERYNIVKRA